MAQARRDENRVPTLIGESALGTTPINVYVDPTTHELYVKASISAGDIQIGAVEIKDGTTDNRATVNGFGALIVDGSGATQPISGTITTGVDSVMDGKFYTNHLDDYTTSNVTYIGQEDKTGTWRMIKIDETGNFPVFTYATLVNNVTLSDYATAWAARTTATYNIYETAF